MEDMRLAVAVLQDTTEMANWRNVAWYLGELGVPQCFDPLRDFVWGNHAHGDPMFYMFDAISSAQGSIGYVAASSYPQAVHYLIQSTNPAFWKSLPWRDPRMTGPEIWLAMSNTSIRALGMSGAAEAGQVLARLRQWPYRDAQRPTIEEALRTNQRVSVRRKYSPMAFRQLSLYHLREILPATDDSSLIGAWRWMRSNGGGAYHAPPTCGWSRTLFFERDSTYSFWEKDSVGENQVCSGRFIVHVVGGRNGGTWIELQNWAWEGPGTFWLRFMGPDLLKLHPGGAEGLWHDWGVTPTFARERVGIAPPARIDAMGWRPPRISRSTLTSYYIELPTPLRRALDSAQLRQWDLSYSSAPVLRGYEYTHYQIPSGVIGDFDGDSLADAAISGYDENDLNEIICLLSNRGSPRLAVAWREPGGSKDRPSRPSYYLGLCPSGQSVLDSRGIRVILASDGIQKTSDNGERSIIHYVNGDFRLGKPLPRIHEN